MSLITLLPTGNNSPWPDFGGNAVTSPTNQGHAITQVFAPFSGGDIAKTCLWGPFPALPGGSLVARLKGSWAYQNADYDDEMSGDLGQISSENLFQFFYNLTGNTVAGINTIVAFSNVLGSNNGTFDIGLSLSQNMANLFLMDIMRAVADGTGANNAIIECSVSDIRVEVVVADNPPVWIG